MFAGHRSSPSVPMACVSRSDSLHSACVEILQVHTIGHIQRLTILLLCNSSTCFSIEYRRSAPCVWYVVRHVFLHIHSS